MTILPLLGSAWDLLFYSCWTTFLMVGKILRLAAAFEKQTPFPPSPSLAQSVFCSVPHITKTM